MILTSSDWNVKEIVALSSLTNDLQINHYHIGGLAESATSPIKVLIHPNASSDESENLRKTAQFLRQIGLTMVISVNCEKYTFIGLRHDLRADEKVAAAALKTIVYGIEGKLDIQPVTIEGFEGKYPDSGT